MRAMDLQDTFLATAFADKAPVTISMSNGFQFRGVIVGFDAFTLVLETDGKQILVYKHSVSSIAPSKKISFDFNLSKFE